MNCFVPALFPFPSVVQVAATNCNPFFFVFCCYCISVQTKYTTKELGEKEANSFSISTLFIGKRPDLCGLSGPDGKAIIGKPKKKDVGRLLGCARG